MRLSGLKIRCINLAKSTERWLSVSSAFTGLKRIEAVDGMAWSDKTYDANGRPNWNTLPRDVCAKDRRYFEMFPTTYGCNLSHLAAIRDFYFSDEDWCIIIEDDTEPVGDYTDFEVPDSADWFYLIGSDHPGCRLSLWQDGQIRMPRTLAAYALSKRAAHIALMAMEPYQTFQTDWQIPMRCFESMIDCNLTKPNWPELPYRIRAYGQRDSIIAHSLHSSVSTFTVDGRKPWIPPSMLC